MTEDRIAAALQLIDEPVQLPAGLERRLWAELAGHIGAPARRWDTLRRLRVRTLMFLAALLALVGGPRLVLAPSSDPEGVRQVETKSVERVDRDRNGTGGGAGNRQPPHGLIGARSVEGLTTGGGAAGFRAGEPLDDGATGHNARSTAVTSVAAREHEEWITFYADPEADNTFATYVMRGDGTGARKVAGQGASQVLPDWSPDGRLLALTDGNDFVLMSPDGIYRRVIAPPAPDQYLRWASWSPDGRSLVATSCTVQDYCSGDLWLIDVATGSVRFLVRGQGASWHPDGRRVVYVDVPDADTCRDAPITSARVRRASYCYGDFRVLELATGRDSALGQYGQFPRYSPDGSMLVWERYNGDTGNDIVVAPVDDLRRWRPLTGAGYDGQPSWTPDGRLLFIRLTTGDQGSIIWIMNVDGSGARALQPQTTIGWNAMPKMAFRPLD